MSLAELLAKEGFKARSKTMARASFRADAATTQRGQRTSSSLSSVKKAERAKSDLSRYQASRETPASDHKGKKPRESFTRLNKGPSTEITEIERSEVAGEETNEIVEVVVENNRKYNDIYYNGVFDDDLGEDKDMKEMTGKYGQPATEYAGVDKSSNSISDKGLPSRSRSYNHRNKQKNLEISGSRLSISSTASKTLGDFKSHRQEKIEQAVAAPSLDEAAVRAVVSIFSGYAKNFMDDEDFRASLHHNSFSSLDLAGLNDGLNTESKVIVNLEQAIETVEKAMEEQVSTKDLKRASLQLSVITGLNSNDLKDGFTSGIPNFKLSACAHLYLGMIYKIQEKDKISAKHLLQVFCDSPFQARTKLLADLWDDAFLPQLWHLKVWYEKESTFLKDSPRKLKLLDKVYKEILDSGTYQFARYYKDWLSEMIEPPTVPSIEVPSRSVWLIQQESRRQSPDTGDSIGHFSMQPTVNRKLYEALFAHSHNTPVEVVDYEEENHEIIAGSSHSSIVEELHMSPYKLEPVVQIHRTIDQDSHQGRQSSKGSHFSKEVPCEDEVIIEKLAKTFFETQWTKISGDTSGASTRERFEDDLYPESPNNFSSPCEGG
ncbi:hypothetical protein Leryth_009596 [Lithospermum erythrorhizon]|nr:hypothetical protein Leryth_009596 [Lithospermum erythrorhizon]